MAVVMVLSEVVRTHFSEMVRQRRGKLKRTTACAGKSMRGQPIHETVLKKGRRC